MATILRIVRVAGSLDIEPDAATSREVAQQAQPTQWPLEDGASISDHTIVMPLTLSLDLTFSPSPMVATFPAPGLGRPKQAQSILFAALQARDIIHVITPDVAYEEMIITSVSSPENASTGSSVNLTVELQQIHRVSAQESAIPASLVARRLRHASSAVDKGQVQIDAASVAQAVATVLAFALPGGATSPVAIAGVARLLGVSPDKVAAVGG